MPRWAGSSLEPRCLQWGQGRGRTPPLPGSSFQEEVHIWCRHRKFPEDRASAVHGDGWLDTRPLRLVSPLWFPGPFLPWDFLSAAELPVQESCLWPCSGGSQVVREKVEFHSCLLQVRACAFLAIQPLLCNSYPRQDKVSVSQ